MLVVNLQDSVFLLLLLLLSLYWIFIYYSFFSSKLVNTKYILWKDRIIDINYKKNNAKYLIYQLKNSCVRLIYVCKYYFQTNCFCIQTICTYFLNIQLNEKIEKNRLK